MNYEAIVDFQNNQNNYNDFWKNKFNFDKKNKSNEYKAYDVRIPEILNIDVLTLINNHIPNSFAIKVNFKLNAPLHIKDDEEFYIISNLMIKEKVFKIPMIRESSWKGALLKASIEIFKNSNNLVDDLKSIFRIFGTGNDTFRAIFEEDKETKSFKISNKNLQLFLALEIGFNPQTYLQETLKEYVDNKYKAKKGRAIFYPTYFDKLSLEVINPHDRKTKAGTNPIFFEVVPKGSEGELQIVYIPFDGVLENNETIKDQAEQDLKFLIKCINKVKRRGIGAKTKLGWGRFKIEKTTCVWSER